MNKLAEVGHNSHVKDVAETGVAAEELKQFVERIERLEEEKKAISDDIKEVFGEMKGRGYDVKVVRQVIKIRKTDRAERQEQEALLAVYLNALGMLSDTPLGIAALRAVK